VTVGPATIVRHSKHAVLVLTGQHKREAATRLRRLDEFDRRWPASVIFECSDWSVVMDRAAAGGGLQEAAFLK
jgi:glucosamine-6-phosphate deaminase